MGMQTRILRVPKWHPSLFSASARVVNASPTGQHFSDHAKSREIEVNDSLESLSPSKLTVVSEVLHPFYVQKNTIDLAWFCTSWDNHESMAGHERGHGRHHFAANDWLTRSDPRWYISLATSTGATTWTRIRMHRRVADVAGRMAARKNGNSLLGEVSQKEREHHDSTWFHGVFHWSISYK